MTLALFLIIFLYICDNNGNIMKKALFRLLGLILGLNVFTACYGPAPGNWDYQDTDQVEATDQNGDEESEGEGEGTKNVEEAQ